MLKNYFLIAIRNLLRNKTLSAINIFGLAVSMSVCLLLILIVADQFSYDSYHEKGDRIYRVITDRVQRKEYLWSTASTAFPLGEQVRTAESVEEVTMIRRSFSSIATWQDAEIPFEGLYTDNQFLSVFDFPLMKGNPKKALSLPNAIVLKKELAHKIFGEADPLNQTINIEGVGEFIVTAIMDDLPGKTHIQFDVLASIDFLQILEKEGKLFTSLDDWNNIYDNYIYFTSKPGATFEDLQSIFDRVVSNNYDQKGEFEYRFYLQPLRDITPGPLLSNTLGFGLPSMFVYIMLAMALVVLTSACFNYANLTTARAINRAKEIGVRKVIGARKRNIIGQFMIEAIVIALVAFVMADLLVQFIHPELNGMFVSLDAPLQFDETPNLYAWFFVFALLAGGLVGIVPALFFAATDPLVALKKSINLGTLSRRFGFAKLNIRKVLVVIQFAFSIFFVITILAVYQQMQMVLTTDHGFKQEGIVNIRLQGLEYEKIRNEFAGLAHVNAVAATTHLPALGTNNTAQVKLEGEEEPYTLSYFGVDQNYMDMMELKLVAGKSFPEQMPQHEQYILINEKAIERWGWDSPQEAVGKMIEIEGQALEVVGVLKDFHYERLDEEIGPMALRYLPKSANSALVTLDGANSRETLDLLEKAWKKQTNRPFEYTFYEDDMRLSYGHFIVIIRVLGYVTIIVVSIACLGLLGMVIFHIQNKTKEIGIRKTLGAEAKDILLTVGRGFLILIVISYLIGGPLAYFVNDMWLQSYAYRIDFGLPALLAGFSMVMSIVILTVGSQVYRALKINPAESLRSE